MAETNRNLPPLIPAAQLDPFKTALQTATTELTPEYLPELDGRAIQQLDKIGPKTEEFVRRVLQIIEENPDFFPPNLKPDVVKPSFELFEQASHLVRLLTPLVTGLTNLSYQAGSVTKSDALQAYALIQAMARSNPTFKAAEEELEPFYTKTRHDKPLS